MGYLKIRIIGLLISANMGVVSMGDMDLDWNGFWPG